MSTSSLEMTLEFNTEVNTSEELVILSAFAKKGTKDEYTPQTNHWPKELRDIFGRIPSSKQFQGIYSPLANITTVRQQIAKTYKAISNNYTDASADLDGFLVKKDYEGTVQALSEALGMTAYQYNKHKSEKNEAKLKTLSFETKEKKTAAKGAEKGLENGKNVGESVNYARDLVNEPPNYLHSVAYAKEIEKDAANLKNVKVKVLGKAELKKEKMGLFLSVNNASAHDARLVQLTYTPPKANKNTKHIALVGKGLTFDSGGYSLKPAGSMVNMKFDMAGSATVYGAFRAAVMMGANVKISCFLGMTDNAINEKATTPDSVFTARNGKTVEIINTDAEGRLVMADCLDYACDQGADQIIDAATLTGSCLVSLGTEICGLMGNDEKFTDQLKKSAKEQDEYLWELPVIEEFKKDLKSEVADLRNIGKSRFGGTSKAAAFLSNFVQEGVSWAHLDIAGIGDSQSYLPYCPDKGASGLMVRTLARYLTNAK